MGKNLPPLIKGLMRAEAYPHEVEEIELIETHISWIILTGRVAYKIKKPLELEFLKSMKLENRLHYCKEEIRLNKRLSPELYLDLSEIIGPPEKPYILESGVLRTDKKSSNLIEVAVKMKQFDQGDLIKNKIKNNYLAKEVFIQLGAKISEFHLTVPRKESHENSHILSDISKPIYENINSLKNLIKDNEVLMDLRLLEGWFKSELIRLNSFFIRRYSKEVIRECHGDLHIGNIRIKPNNEVEIFDGIDFCPELRWIDPISEIAFLIVDLEVNGHFHDATTLLNKWLEDTGDYISLKLLKFYSTYRALVRAKVCSIRKNQLNILIRDDKVEALKLDQSTKKYIKKAVDLQKSTANALIIMHGLSGSGKSFISEHICNNFTGVRIRSDIERKRICGRTALQNKLGPRNAQIEPLTSQFFQERDIYNQKITKWLFYQHMPKLARSSLLGGKTTIIDATFLRKKERLKYLFLADDLKIPYIIINCECPDTIAKERIMNRINNRNDPSEAHFLTRENQKSWIEPLSYEEKNYEIKYSDSKTPSDLMEEIDFLIQSQKK